MMTRQHAKRTLKMKGHSYRSAAAELGCSYRHLAGVLMGERISRSLLHRIDLLPARQNIPHNSPYRRTEAVHV
jgi:hypothetical protein